MEILSSDEISKKIEALYGNEYSLLVNCCFNIGIFYRNNQIKLGGIRIGNLLYSEESFSLYYRCFYCRISSNNIRWC